VALAAGFLGVAPSARGDDAAPAIASADGVPVQFVSKDPAMSIFLAKGDVPTRAFPDPFERVGHVPLTVRLSPGVYTVETSSPTTSTGHERIFVEAGAPVTVEVRGGDSSVKAIGTVLIALGAVAATLGVVAIVSISPHDENYNRFGIGLPLLLGGAGGAAVGVGMVALGSTNVVAPHLPPGGLPGGPRSRPAAVGVSWSVRF
jgi:hypothetical protein